MGKHIVTPDIIQRLYDAGLLKEPPNMIRRVVLDFKANHVALMYIEKFTDDAILDVIAEAGLHIVSDGEPAEVVGRDVTGPASLEAEIEERHQARQVE